MGSGPIVVGYLATAEGAAALEAAIAEALRRARRLIVVVSQRRADDTRDLQNDLDSVRDRLDEVGIGYEIREMERGRDVADDLLDVAEATQAELVVIGLRRRSPVGKLVLGANAQRILLDSATPVLAVKST